MSVTRTATCCAFNGQRARTSCKRNPVRGSVWFRCQVAAQFQDDHAALACYCRNSGDRHGFRSFLAWREADFSPFAKVHPGSDACCSAAAKPSCAHSLGHLASRLGSCLGDGRIAVATCAAPWCCAVLAARSRRVCGCLRCGLVACACRYTRAPSGVGCARCRRYLVVDGDGFRLAVHSSRRCLAVWFDAANILRRVDVWRRRHHLVLFAARRAAVH